MSSRRSTQLVSLAFFFNSLSANLQLAKMYSLLRVALYVVTTVKTINVPMAKRLEVYRGEDGAGRG